MMTKNKFLLIGGEGFLGKGLQEELSNKCIRYKSIDIHNYDLTKPENIQYLVNDLHDITHIVLLASKVGAYLFEDEENAKQAGIENRLIFENVIEAVKTAYSIYKKQFVFIYYSSCEIFWSLKNKKTYIDLDTPVNYNMDITRSCYAHEKYRAEQVLKKLHEENTCLKSVRILRPFNISGKYEQRGVVYYMLYSALKTNTICYNRDTTRTITPDWIARQLAVEYSLIDNNEYSVHHLVDSNNSFTLKWLATMIKYVLEEKYRFKNIKLKSNKPDKTIRYRQTCKINKLKHVYYFLPKLELIIERIINDIRI